MSKLGDAMEEALTGAVHHEEGFRSWMSELLGRAGTVTGAAREAGVARSTWQRWASGKIASPKPATVERLGAVVRSGRVRAGGPTDTTVRVNTVEPDQRHRTIGARSLKIREGTMDQTRAAYVKGGSDQAAGEFLKGVGDNFYRSWLTEPELEDLTGEESDIDSEYHPESVAIGA